jgi:hypothetical protein
MDLPKRDPKKKINLEVTATQLNGLGNIIMVFKSMAEGRTLDVAKHTRYLFETMSMKEIIELGQYFAEVADREDPLTSRIGPVRIILESGGGKS